MALSLLLILGCRSTTNMRAQEFVTELNIDNKAGWGQTPNNQEIDYMGLKVRMRPSTFLRLAAELTIDADARKKIDIMKAHAQAGGTFGAPTLYIDVPDEWKEGKFLKRPRIRNHEGRHRMNTEMELNGDQYVETHIFLRSERSEWKHKYGGDKSDFKEDVIYWLSNGGITSEDGLLITRAPLFIL